MTPYRSTWVQIDWPAPSNVRAGYTLRTGGVSSGAFLDFNIAHHVGDDRETVDQNRAALLADVGRPICWLSQTHTNRIVRADAAHLGQEADAAWTDNRDFAAAVMTADCLPVFFCNDAGSWVAVAHAGWRGLANGILGNTVAAYPGKRDQLMAYLGPAIGPTAFEVGDDVRDAFVQQNPDCAEAFLPGVQPGKWWADIYQLARIALNAVGVTRVTGGTDCTYTDSDRFYSYRRDGTTGRMANIIWIES